MKKYAYLAKLEALLADLPEQEREDALTYYEEYIDAAGKEQEAQTIAALGSPEEVAQKILEGEGLTAEPTAPTDAPQPPADAAPAGAAAGAAAVGAASCGGPHDSGPQTGAPQPAVPQPPAAPEPPAAFSAGEPAPAAYAPAGGAGGFHPFQNPPKPFSRRGWIIFVCVIAAALIIQLAFLAIHFAGSGRGTRQVTVVDTATSHAPVVSDSGDYDLFEGDDYDDFDDHAEHIDHGTAAAVEAPADYADGTVSLYDDAVQEIELHITSANLSISHDGSVPDEVHLEISGLDADKFETSYRTDDGRRKLVVRDGRAVSANTPAEQTTVTLTLPQNFREVEANVVTGNIILGELSLGDVELKTSTGDIETGALTVGKLDLKTNTGNITVGPVTPGAGEHEVELKTGTGSISAALNAAQSDYEYEIKTRRGTIQLNGQTLNSSAQSRSGRYELEASADTGDVSVTFAG